jgi:ElaB/YqjD/DUF883 family membrane-anchored ribosome-binding protein
MAHGYLSRLRSHGEDARDSAEDYRRRASRSLHDAGDTLRHRGDDARGELARLWHQLEDLVERRIAPAASDAAHHARDYAHDGREMAAHMAAQVRDAARARPLAAIGIAVVATWLITTMLRSRR